MAAQQSMTETHANLLTMSKLQVGIKYAVHQGSDITRFAVFNHHDNSFTVNHVDEQVEMGLVFVNTHPEYHCDVLVSAGDKVIEKYRVPPSSERNFWGFKNDAGDTKSFKLMKKTSYQTIVGNDVANKNPDMDMIKIDCVWGKPQVSRRIPCDYVDGPGLCFDGLCFDGPIQSDCVGVIAPSNTKSRTTLCNAKQITSIINTRIIFYISIKLNTNDILTSYN